MVILFGMLVVLLFIGFPVDFALIGASLAFILLESPLPMVVVIHRTIGGIDSFTLLAVPFFILAGNLMNHAGITDRIFDFANAREAYDYMGESRFMGKIVIRVPAP